MPDYLTGGGSTRVHGLTAPENYANFTDLYYNLMETIDEGAVITVATAADLTAYEGGSHSDVFAFVKDEEEFYVSSGGTFTSMNMIFDTANISPTEKSELTNTLSDNFLLLSGGTMSGDINMNRNMLTAIAALQFDNPNNDFIHLVDGSGGSITGPHVFRFDDRALRFTATGTGNVMELGQTGTVFIPSGPLNATQVINANSGIDTQGNVEMNGNNVNNASKVEANDKLILPIK